MKTLYIGNSYFAEKDKQDVLDEYVPCKPTGFFKRNLILKPASKLSLYSIIELFFTDWKKKVSDYEQIIIAENSYVKNIDLAELRVAKKLAPNAKIVYWFRNTYADQEMKSKINKVKKYTSDIYTFDKIQSEKFQIKYNTQNFPTKIMERDFLTQDKYDISIVASLKDRGSSYLKIIKYAKENNLNLFAAIVIKRFKKLPDRLLELDPFVHKKFLSKEEYDFIIANSKATIDFYQSGQEGETLRVFEATLLKKKIITNNSNLKKLPFYNSNNFFFFGEQDISELKKFINSPYDENIGDTLSYYELKNWLRRFELHV